MAKLKSNYFLFIICSLIWGTTWLVIKFQINTTAPSISVFYRFFLAAILMFIFNHFVTKETLKWPMRNHLFFFLQGIFNFSFNYILTYLAEKTLSSGLVALTFTSLVYFNMIGMRLWFKRSISKNVFIGGILGAVGIVSLFWPELSSFNLTNKGPLFGVIIGIVATFFASTGNMFAFKNYQMKVPVVIFNTYGMLYGALSSFIISIILGEKFLLPLNASYIFSLLYLVVFGSIIAFWAYQTLVGTLGADRAAYTSIISPMIAVVVSGVFENVSFTWNILIGILFCLLGNYLALKKEKVPADFA